MIFVNLSGDAPPFEEANAALIRRWAAFDRPLFHGGPESTFELTLAANWKLVVENYYESYHLPWVHPGLNSYSRLEDHYNITDAGAFSGQGTRVYRRFRAKDGATFPDFDDLPEAWDEAAEYIALYPNLLLGTHRDHAFAIGLIPEGPERTREIVHITYAASGTDEAMRRANAALWRQVFDEDIFVVEGMQRGRHARGFDGGRFSPVMDAPTQCLHARAAARLPGR